MILRRTELGDAVVETSVAADFLRVTSAEEHEFITALVEAATLHAEAFCGRDLRTNQYEILRNGFGEVDYGYNPLSLGFLPVNIGFIPIRRATVASVEEVAYLKDDAFSVIATSVYYLSIGLSKSRLLLKLTQAWPTDSDDIEDNVRIRFTTRPPDNVDIAKAGILRHVALMYADRGDAEVAQSGSSPSGATVALASQTARQSGAEGLYHALQIPSL